MRPDNRVDVALIQTKPRKGEYRANLTELGSAFSQIVAERTPDLIVLPEAALTGYFLEGAVYDCSRSAAQLADDLAQKWREAAGDAPIDLVCGFYENLDGTYFNSALYLHVELDQAPQIVHVHRKMFLPTYGVFDEDRFLSRGRRLGVFQTRFGKAAMLICEDVWHSLVPTIAAVKGARILIVPSAAPGRGIEGAGELESIVRWREILQNCAAEHGLFLVYAGLAGFEGGKGMTGSSCMIDPRGRMLVQAPAIGACIVRAELDLHEIDRARAMLPLLGDLGAVLPDLLLDDELPLPRGLGDAAGH
ncbi:MAG: beta-ureidopropionase [Candidatus Eremiobacteraeota bacterium]|nr:beta-ureidopropionase [Candidatus Eremiobacteraeota bacterium]